MLNTLNSYVPILIRKRVAQKPEPINAPEIQSTEAAVLLADISGFTRYTENVVRDDPRGVEKISTALNDYFGRWIDVIHEYGGDVVKFAGDAITAVWEVDPQNKDMRSAVVQAAACALHAHNTLRGYQTAEGAPLVIRTGIASGTLQTVHLGGQLKRWELLIAGEVIRDVSFIMQQAAPDTIVLSSSAQKFLGNSSYGKTLPEGGYVLSGLEIKAQRYDPTNLFIAPQEATGALSNYIPGAIKNKLASGQVGWLADLRTISALFINFPGLNQSTQLQTAQEIIQELQKTLYHYEGSLNKVIVDEKGATGLAAFGLPPFSHEDDALRATRAALDIQQKMTALGLQVTIGIATGQTFCGSIGNNMRREYTMIGQTVNLSARLSRAGVGLQGTESIILTDEATASKTRQRIRFEKMPPIQIKGWSNLVTPFVPQQTESQTVGRMDTAIIGRASERNEIRQSILKLHEPTTHASKIFVIEGEPGIGKSHLLADALAQARASGLPVSYGATDAVERATPYHVWRAIISNIFGLDANASTQARCDMLASKLDDDLLERASLLNDILQVNFPATELTSNLEGRVLAENTRSLLSTLLERALVNDSRVIAIEDAHWMDTASWALLLDIARLTLDTKLVFLLTTRPLSVPMMLETEALLQLNNTKHLLLERMPAEDALALVQQKLGVDELPQSVKLLISEKAEGHPFFSEELAYSLRDAGILLIESGSSRLAPGMENLERLKLPETVQGVITSRIDRLAPVEQLTLKVASVIGRVFEYSTLNAIYPVEDERTLIRSSLLNLQQLDITPLETPDPDLAYIFKHSITREVAYNLMLFAQRRQLHKSVAEWYEAIHTTELEPYYGLLAHHYALAEEPVKATFYIEKAGLQALAGGAYVEAANYFEEAIRLAGLHHKTLRASKEQLASWEYQLAEAYFGLGRLEKSGIHFENSAKLLGYPSHKSRGRLLISVLAQVAKQAFRLFTGRLPHPAKNIDAVLGASRAHERLVEIYYFAQNRPLLLHSALLALNLAQHAPNSPDLARGYIVAATVCGVIPLHGLAQKYKQLAQETAGKTNHLPSIARVASRSGLYNIGIGEIEKANQELDQAVEIAERLRDFRQSGESASLRAWTSYLVADYEDNILRFNNVYKVALQTGNLQFQNWGQWGQAHGLVRLNRLAEAKEALNRVIERFKKDEDSGAKVIAYGLLSLIAMHQQDWETMLHYGKELTLPNKKSARFSIADFEGFASVAEVFLTLWERELQASFLPSIGFSLEECKLHAEYACKGMSNYARVYDIGKPRAALMNGWLSFLQDKNEDAVKQWSEGLQVAETLNLKYEQARLHYTLGLHLPAGDASIQTHYQFAYQVFTDVNAVLDLKNVKLSLPISN